MSQKDDLILKKIKYIRKSKRRSIHDCAVILGISNEAYHRIEKGETPLTIPELELLAIYLGENPADLIDSDNHPQPYAVLMDDNVRQQFKQIREKMLRALITIERENQDKSFEDIHQGTDIPLEKLHAYNDVSAQLPYDDILKICAFLEIPMDALHVPLWPTKANAEDNSANKDWRPEFILTSTDENISTEDPFIDIVTALRKLLPEDQAYIVKYLLTKLKSM